MGRTTHGAASERILTSLIHWGHAIAQLNARVADRVGVNLSDMDCLYALRADGPTTASALVGRVGLTSGSVSRMIDRLDAAGCVARVPDPADRRRVLIEPTAEGGQRIRAHYDGLSAGTVRSLDEFTDDELAVIERFLDRARACASAELDRLRAR